jgi:hypothetical protein
MSPPDENAISRPSGEMPVGERVFRRRFRTARQTAAVDATIRR